MDAVASAYRDLEKVERVRSMYRDAQFKDSWRDLEVTYMRDGGHHFLYGPLQRLRAYVQLVPLLSLALPNLGYRNMPIGPWGALYGDNWFLQLPAEPIRIDCPENLF